MSLSDKIARFSAGARWRADQQVRLIQKQNEIRVVENTIRQKKSELAEETLKLFFDKELIKTELINICDQIYELKIEVKEKNSTLEDIKNEIQPGYTNEVIGYSSISANDNPGNVCPICHQSLTRSHCPEHGVKGVLFEDNEQVMDISNIPSDLQTE